MNTTVKAKHFAVNLRFHGFQTRTKMVGTALDTITHDDVIEEEPEDIDDADDGFDDADDYDQYEYREEKIIIPSPKVSIDENDIPIIVNNQVSETDTINQEFKF